LPPQRQAPNPALHDIVPDELRKLIILSQEHPHADVGTWARAQLLRRNRTYLKRRARSGGDGGCADGGGT
jgi:hypothetical protein